MNRKVFEPGFGESRDRLEAYADFVAIVRQLRRDCPWDRVQTHESVKHLMIEETYEAVQAIDENNWDELKKELGDVLLHVVFHSVMAEEAGSFTLKEVLETESDKLIRRHPHVFGDVKVNGVDDVLTNWEEIKMNEGKRKSALQGVPKNLPALLRSHRVLEKAASVGFVFPDQADAWQKVQEELGEFREYAGDGTSPEKREEEFGDLLFALVNYARFIDVNPENALRRTNDKFARRFQYVEKQIEESGRKMSEVDLAEMERYWNEAKEAEPK